MSTPPVPLSSSAAPSPRSSGARSASAAADAPRLAPPGAGLPRVELWIARGLFRWRAHTTSREAAVEAIVREREAILALARRCAPADATRPVLIQRLRGLEDSSRYWSVCMTLAHLRIVNQATRATMVTLLAGRRPPGVASTAAVKPDPAAGREEIAGFERSCEALLEVERATPTLKTELRHAHPWFGPLDAADWFFMAGFHLALHRQQLEAILAGLPKRTA